MSLAIVALAAACGAVSRYLLDHYLAARAGSAFPWGTFAVNVSGSFALGLLVGVALVHDVPTPYMLAVGTGFLGAYTTFSTWMVEILRLLAEGAWKGALLHALGSLVAGTAAAALGLGLGSVWGSAL